MQEPTAQRHRIRVVEAKLVAYRSGWLRYDAARVRALKRELENLTAAQSSRDALAHELLQNP